MCVTANVVYTNCGCVLEETPICVAAKPHKSYKTPVKQYMHEACDTCAQTSKGLAEHLTTRLQPKKVETGMTEKEKALSKTELWETLL